MPYSVTTGTTCVILRKIIIITRVRAYRCIYNIAVRAAARIGWLQQIVCGAVILAVMPTPLYSMQYGLLHVSDDTRQYCCNVYSPCSHTAPKDGIHQTAYSVTTRRHDTNQQTDQPSTRFCSPTREIIGLFVVVIIPPPHSPPYPALRIKILYHLW